MDKMRFYFLIICFAVLYKVSYAKTMTNPDSIHSTINDSMVNKNTLDISNLGNFYFPIHGKVISHFGMRGAQYHPGTDIKLNHGDTVRAGFKGIVSKASKYYGYGILVIIDHGNNMCTYYAHLCKAIVQVGDTIAEGTPIGLGGRTGWATTDHLHFEIRLNQKAYNPEQLFDFNNLMVISNKSVLSPKLASIHKPASENKFHQEFHIINKNDTLYSLAKRYGTSVKALCDLNGIEPTSTLKIGEKLKMF